MQLAARDYFVRLLFQIVILTGMLFDLRGTIHAFPASMAVGASQDYRSRSVHGSVVDRGMAGDATGTLFLSAFGRLAKNGLPATQRSQNEHRETAESCQKQQNRKPGVPAAISHEKGL